MIQRIPSWWTPTSSPPFTIHTGDIIEFNCYHTNDIYLHRPFVHQSLLPYTPPPPLPQNARPRPMMWYVDKILLPRRDAPFASAMLILRSVSRHLLDIYPFSVAPVQVEDNIIPYGPEAQPAVEPEIVPAAPQPPPQPAPVAPADATADPLLNKKTYLTARILIDDPPSAARITADIRRVGMFRPLPANTPLRRNIFIPLRYTHGFPPQQG